MKTCVKTIVWSLIIVVGIAGGAICEAQTYTLTINAENGTVTKDPNLSEYEKDTSVILTATANPGYQFSSWSGDVSGSDNPLTITMNSDKNITATFIEETVSGNGIVLDMNFENENNRLEDASVNAFEGTWVGTESYVYDSERGGYVLNLDGNSYVRVYNPENGPLGGTNNVIVSVWAKKNSITSTGGLFITAGKYKLQLINIGDNTHDVEGVITTSGGSAGFSILDQEADTNWHHYILAYNGSTAKIYVDNELQLPIKQLTGSLNTTNGYLYIGSNGSISWGSFNGFEGQIDDFVIMSGNDMVPGVPAGLSGTAVSHVRIDLSWDENSLPESDFVEGYEIYRDDGSGAVCIGTSTTSSYQDTIGLEPEHTYNYQIAAFNMLGNRGDPTNSISVTTHRETVILSSTTISRFGISWTLVKEGSSPEEYVELTEGEEYGTFANGDYWVVGPARIIEINPASREFQHRLLASGLAGTFSDGETVTQAVTGATGTVYRQLTEDDGTAVYINPTTDVLFDMSNVVTGGTSGATMTPSKITWCAINGTMINPVIRGVQGYDSRVNGGTGYEYLDETFSNEVQRAYDPDLNIGKGISIETPLIVEPNSSLISSLSIDITPGEYTNFVKPIIKAAILTVLSAAPPDGSFRPTYTASDKTVEHNISDLDLQEKLLKTLDVPENIDIVPYNGDEDDLAVVEGWFEQTWLDHARSGRMLQSMSPREDSCGYGTACSVRSGLATLLLNLDYTDPAIGELNQDRKDILLVRLVQVGIDLYGILTNGGAHRWVGRGGHNSGRKWPILFTGIMLNNENMIKAVSDPNYYFQEDHQTYYEKTWTGALVSGTGGNHVLTPAGDHEHTHPREWTVDGGGRGARQVTREDFADLEAEVGNPALSIFDDLRDRGDIDEEGNVNTRSNSIYFPVRSYEDFTVDPAYASVKSKVYVILRQHLPDIWFGSNSDLRAELYRLDCNAHTWIGTAFSARVMGAIEEWGHQAYFDYVDRWMTENFALLEPIMKQHCDRRSQHITWNMHTVPGDTMYNLEKAMWDAYRLDYDDVKPTAPELSITNQTNDEVTLAFDSWDSLGVKYYKVYRDNVQIETGIQYESPTKSEYNEYNVVLATITYNGDMFLTITEYTDSGLDTANNNYVYYVRAYDEKGNESEVSNVVRIGPTPRTAIERAIKNLKAGGATTQEEVEERIRSYMTTQ